MTYALVFYAGATLGAPVGFILAMMLVVGKNADPPEPDSD